MKKLIRFIFLPFKPFFMKIKLYLPLYMYYIYLYTTIRFIKTVILHIKRKNTQDVVLEKYSGEFSEEIDDYIKNKEIYVSRYGQPQIEGTRDFINNRYEYLRNEIDNIYLKNILDVGCGVGHHVKFLIRDFKNTLVVGFDYSFGRSVTAYKYVRKNSKILNASAINIPFLDKSFDLVITSHVLEQIKYDIDKVLQEINRIAKGKVIFLEPYVEFMGIFHRMYHYANDYPRIKNKVDKYFKIEKFYIIPVGSFVQTSGILVCSKK